MPNTIIAIPGFSEPVSSLTHLLAAGLFLALSIWLVIKTKPGLGYRFPVGLFGFAIVFVLSMSGVFHLLEPGTTARHILQRLDHAGIFFLIAGTFTPVHSILFKGGWRWGMLIPIWVVAITGLTLKTIFFTDIPEWLGLTFYLGLGWLGAISATVLYRRYGYAFIKPLVYGAIAYSVGAVMEFLRQPILIKGVIGAHEIFHIAVLLGISFHFVFVKRFCTQTELQPIR